MSDYVEDMERDWNSGDDNDYEDEMNHESRMYEKKCDNELELEELEKQIKRGNKMKKENSQVVSITTQLKNPKKNNCRDCVYLKTKRVRNVMAHKYCQKRFYVMGYKTFPFRYTSCRYFKMKLRIKMWEKLKKYFSAIK